MSWLKFEKQKKQLDLPSQISTMRTEDKIQKSGDLLRRFLCCEYHYWHVAKQVNHWYNLQRNRTIFCRKYHKTSFTALEVKSLKLSSISQAPLPWVDGNGNCFWKGRQRLRNNAGPKLDMRWRVPRERAIALPGKCLRYKALHQYKKRTSTRHTSCSSSRAEQLSAAVFTNYSLKWKIHRTTWKRLLTYCTNASPNIWRVKPLKDEFHSPFDERSRKLDLS